MISEDPLVIAAKCILTTLLDQLRGARCWLLERVGTATGRERDRRPRGPPVPTQLLQELQRLLPLHDLLQARLVCREWAAQLGAQVQAVQLPPHLWQHSPRGAAHAALLYASLPAFSGARTAHLTHDKSAPTHAATVHDALLALSAATPCLRSLNIHGISAPQHWRALLPQLSLLAHRLRSLTLDGGCLPCAAGAAPLAQLTALTHLRLHSTVFSRLHPEHLAAVAGLAELRHLSLGFRTADATVRAPLPLDALFGLSHLTRLEVDYTGIPELVSLVSFQQPQELTRLGRLCSLAIEHVPLPHLSPLACLTALTQLTLRQVRPLSATQAAALARCTRLARLSLAPLPAQLLPELAALTQLSELSLELGQPSRSGDGGRGGGSAAAADLCALLPRALGGLAGLRALRLHGPVEVSRATLEALAPGWQLLERLDLQCDLPDGNRGLQLLGGLRSLRLQPHRWDAWGCEPPVLLWPEGLPPGLTSFEGIDVWCVGGKAAWSGLGWGATAAGGTLAAGPGDGSTALCVPHLHAHLHPQLPPPAGQFASAGLRVLVLRSVCQGGDVLLRLPDISGLSQLQELDLEHSQLSSRHLEAVAAALANSLTSLRVVAAGDTSRVGAAGVVALARLQRLQRLSLCLQPRALSARARRALCGMAQLRELSLRTAPHNPASFAASLRGQLGRLGRLRVLRVGLGFGTLHVLRWLGDGLARTLPDCRYEMLL